MIKMKKIYLFTILLAGFGSTAFAQVSSTATSTATIVTPISIAKTIDMNFGNVAVSATAGTVVLAPAGTRTPTGGVTLPVTAGTVTAASFTVTGTAGYTYAITLPTTAVTLINGTFNMTAAAFTSTPTTTGTLSAGGTQTLNVGATLAVAASQAAGLYASTASGFTVTVNYN